MADLKKNKAGKPALSLFDLIKKAGFESQISKQKTKLWGEPTLIQEDLEDFDFYISQLYSGSSFVVLREGTESIAVSMASDEISEEQLASYDVVNDKGLVEDVDFSINIGVVTALRDDDELGISAGEQKLKAYLA